MTTLQTNQTTTRAENIRQILSNLGEPEYRQNQVFDAIYRQGVKSYADITNLSKNLRETLTTELGELLTLKPISQTKDQFTQKVLFETLDGNKLEAVKINYKDHTTLCVSSQSGCALGCKFCATGALGFHKNLTVDELCDQLLYFIQSGEKIDNLVFMGMGEPFANPNLFDVLHMLTSAQYFGIGQRKISVSTVGIIPGIQNLAKEFPQINLAFSLHSPFADQRCQLMPVTKAYPIDKVFNALNEYIAITNRKVFIAYLLINGVTDTPEHAKALAHLLKRQGPKAYLYHVNLIKFHESNVVKGFKQPNEMGVEKFGELLRNRGIDYTVRQSFGEEIDAACGQLTAKG